MSMVTAPQASQRLGSPTSNPMAQTSKLSRYLAAAAAVIVAVVGITLYSERTETSEPQPTPVPAITATATGIRTVPDVPATTRRSAAAALTKTLDTLYTRAFIPPVSDQAVGRSPSPAPALRIESRVRGLMTARAIAALKKSRGVFEEIDELDVYDGTVEFRGVITFAGTVPVDALLHVDFTGHATPPGRTGPRVRIRQFGEMRLVRTANTWLVDGFDLRLTTRPLPTPEPTAG